METVMDPTDDPYTPALGWISRNPDHKSAVGLAKLIFSLWDEDAVFSLRECIGSLDKVRRGWALKIVTHFLLHGDNRQLYSVGDRLRDMCPLIWLSACVGAEARAAAAERIRQINRDISMQC